METRACLFHAPKKANRKRPLDNARNFLYYTIIDGRNGPAFFFDEIAMNPTNRSIATRLAELAEAWGVSRVEAIECLLNYYDCTLGEAKGPPELEAEALEFVSVLMDQE